MDPEPEKVPNKEYLKEEFNGWEPEPKKVPSKSSSPVEIVPPETDQFEDSEELKEDQEVPSKEEKLKKKKAKKNKMDGWETVPKKKDKRKDKIDEWDIEEKVPNDKSPKEGISNIGEKSKPLRRPFASSTSQTKSELSPFATDFQPTSTVGNVERSIAPRSPVRTAGRGTSIDCCSSIASDVSSVSRFGRGIGVETTVQRFVRAPPTMMGVGRGIGRGVPAPPPGNNTFSKILFNF